jgi:hypothetical protein
MNRLCVLGSIAANARLVGADAAVPAANMLTPPMSASRRDIVSVRTKPSSCLSIIFLRPARLRGHHIKSATDDALHHACGITVSQNTTPCERHRIAVMPLPDLMLQLYQVKIDPNDIRMRMLRENGYVDAAAKSSK